MLAVRLVCDAALTVSVTYDRLIRGERGRSVAAIIKLGIVVVGTLGLCFLPFLAPGDLAQVLHRIFPFERGLFEDKVANFWCAISVVIKLKRYLTHSHLARLWCVMHGTYMQRSAPRLTPHVDWSY